MSARIFGAALLAGLVAVAVSASNADEPPSRIFHIGIVAGTSRSSPERVAFEDRLRELGYVAGRNLTIDFVRDDDPNRLAEAAGEFARRGVDVIVTGGQDVLKAAITATVGRAAPGAEAALRHRLSSIGTNRHSAELGYLLSVLGRADEVIE
jgi:hypothetical protein